ncbi:tellurite resistance TerB family protein [Kaistia dalseonensis]|uniref:Uncharacterized membrane protein YebE (DUF533 family) n=1 Tax=Kaistia dalseonensis TaxID=410840 RepID=A0ABU0HB13_9HYPH|nr:tellurite resistance TerB family protein [Kaistia dalseonensis]MCX5496879.1 tellurite resistance TerB family protein [Kaistia dalseonensis]MDQ0439505.1 uncharacterized membrane protein YebE (DUF533 family) [Kaistia dalseonensis]
MFDSKKLLDQLLGAAGGQGTTAQGASGGLGNLGGLGDLVGGVLGGGQSSGGGLGGVVGQVTDYAKKNPGLSTVIAGGLATVLLGGKGPKIKADALTLGGLAAIGTLAYKAYQQYKINNPDAPPPATPASVPQVPAPADTGFNPANAGAPDLVALSIISAMIAAAKADGKVDETEKQKIIGKLSEGGLSAEEQAFLNTELAAPLDINRIVDSATGPEHSIQLYAASLLVIAPPGSPAERAYLDMLAARFGFDAQLKTAIEQTVASAAA